MLCPKCRRPLENDEQYVCCSDAALTWRCAGCGKVSEGFAFPYGACPLCGGTLEILEAKGGEDAYVVEGVRIAFEIELGGHAFYAVAACEASDPELRELFGKLAAMEQEHMQTLSRRYHAEIPQGESRFRAERAAIYAGIPYRPEDPANLFRIAIACEQQAARFFGERSESEAAHPDERQLYRELAAEESEHAALLLTEYERWKAGKAGLL